MGLQFSLKPAAQKTAAASESELHELAIIGGGPAGLTAAIYAARSAVRPIVFAGALGGGQIANTAHVENYPGFPNGISGGELAMNFQAQAERLGARVVPEMVKSVDFSKAPFTLSSGERSVRARAVIVATGAFPRRLGVPGEREFYGRGVSTCATCDGFFFKDKKVIVVGGGDSALDEGLFLTKFARQVVVVHRRDQLRASQQLQQRAFANERMSFVWNSVVDAVLGAESVDGVRVRNVLTDETSEIEADGVFVFVGLVPATTVFKGQLDLTQEGYVAADDRGRTSVPGVFAAGDVRNPDFRQCVIAAGSGATAAMEAERYLSGL